MNPLYLLFRALFQTWAWKSGWGEKAIWLMIGLVVVPVVHICRGLRYCWRGLRAIKGTRIVAVWAILAGILLLFPRYVVKGRPGEYLDAGWGFVFTGPILRLDKTSLLRFWRRELSLDESVPEVAVWDAVRARILEGASFNPVAKLKFEQLSTDALKSLMQRSSMVKPNDPVTRRGGFPPESAFVDFRMLVLIQAILAGIMGAWILTDARTTRQGAIRSDGGDAPVSSERAERRSRPKRGPRL